jgi:hypothetical protein
MAVYSVKIEQNVLVKLFDKNTISRLRLSQKYLVH